MKSMLRFGTALVVVSALIACSDATGPLPALTSSFASGSSGGGGSGGVSLGGGGGGVKPCAILTLTIFNDVLNNLAVPSFWQPNTSVLAQITGSTEKSCDTIPNATIKFEDLSDSNAECSPVVTSWVNNPNYLNPKYGAKPMSRFREMFIYNTGANCIGQPRLLRATLTDPSVGGSVTSTTFTWIP